MLVGGGKRAGTGAGTDSSLNKGQGLGFHHPRHGIDTGDRFSIMNSGLVEDVHSGGSTEYTVGDFMDIQGVVLGSA